MARYYWQDDDADEINETDAMETYLWSNKIDSVSLSKRFNDLVALEKKSIEFKIYQLIRDIKSYQIALAKEAKKQEKLGVYIDIFSRVDSDMKRVKFFKAKENVQINIDGLENPANEHEKWELEAFVKTVGKNPKTITSYLNSYEKKLNESKEKEKTYKEKIEEFEREKEHCMQTEYKDEFVEKNKETRYQISLFANDLYKFTVVYPDQEFVSGIKKMINSCFNTTDKEVYITTNTIDVLLKKVAYGEIENKFKTKEVERV